MQDVKLVDEVLAYGEKHCRQMAVQRASVYQAVLIDASSL